jgi:hypothetical protein
MRRAVLGWNLIVFAITLFHLSLSSAWASPLSSTELEALNRILGERWQAQYGRQELVRVLYLDVYGDEILAAEIQKFSFSFPKIDLPYDSAFLDQMVYLSFELSPPGLWEASGERSRGQLTFGIQDFKQDPRALEDLFKKRVEYWNRCAARAKEPAHSPVDGRGSGGTPVFSVSLSSLLESPDSFERPRPGVLAGVQPQDGALPSVQHEVAWEIYSGRPSIRMRSTAFGTKAAEELREELSESLIPLLQGRREFRPQVLRDQLTFGTVPSSVEPVRNMVQRVCGFLP